MKTRTVEEKHYFANRLDFQQQVSDWMKDSKINRIWITDRFWLKTDPKRYEVTVAWEES